MSEARKLAETVVDNFFYIRRNTPINDESWLKSRIAGVIEEAVAAERERIIRITDEYADVGREIKNRIREVPHE